MFSRRGIWPIRIFIWPPPSRVIICSPCDTIVSWICQTRLFEFCFVQIVEIRQQMKRLTHGVLPLTTFQFCPRKPVGRHRSKIPAVRWLHRIFTCDCPQRPKPVIGRLLHLTQDKDECVRPHANNLLVSRMCGQFFDGRRWRARLLPDVYQGMESRLKTHQPIRGDCVDIRF